MGEIIVHLDREWVGGVIRMDYKWQEGEKTFLIKDIPCKDFPSNEKDYLEGYVSLALLVIMDLQKEGKLDREYNFVELENDELLEELKTLVE